MATPENPFQLTRAADLDDSQVNSLWVNLESQGGFSGKFRPKSQLPMIVLGGKGSGKTHLMRYYSYPLQKMRAAPGKIFEAIQRSGYIGVYVRCSGLNASRFSGKGQSREQWAAVFEYYVELWFAQVVLEIAVDFIANSGARWQNEEAVTRGIHFLFDKNPATEITTIAELMRVLRDLQRELDFAVNNAALTRSLSVTVLTTRGSLIFGIPRTLAQHEPAFSSLTFTWLIDEYENLYEDAQRYINTLLREKQLPVTFKVGARLYGLRTYKTWSGDEELKEGSEYELLNLDSELRNLEEGYVRFAAQVCKTRLRVYWGDLAAASLTNEKNDVELSDRFENERNLPPEQTELGIATAKFLDRDRPWISRLQKQIKQAKRTLAQRGLRSGSDIEHVLNLLSWRDDLLVEKTNVFLFYRSWSRKGDLLESATQIRSDCETFSNTKSEATAHWKVLDKFREDLKAQVIRECNGKPFYVGLETFVVMSQGIARNLLTILKHVYDWAVFNGERPFVKDRISVRSQRAGVAEAYDWFIRDAQILGQDGRQVKAAIARLGDLFRAIRFSDKPSECSLCTFSVNFGELGERTQRMIEAAAQWSLLIPTADRIERNTGNPVAKYQLNGMMAPHYWLPVNSRGNIHLSASEAEVIFTNPDTTHFTNLVANRVKGMNAPFCAEEEQSHEPTLF